MNIPNTWIEEAKARVDDAETLLAHDRPSRAVSAAYFASNAAALAALHLRGEDVKTHKGILNRLSYHFIRTGRLPKDVSSRFSDLLDCRLQADYDLRTFCESEARAKINEARQCIAHIATLFPSE